eukprot:GHVH01010100.1.p1 GENE.GHVH01010100.1~~GHVH01010100.1.p1  ORF type:complete len:318 (+),score=11.64 GHVH01010100.1:118-1071(+)
MEETARDDVQFFGQRVITKIDGLENQNVVHTTDSDLDMNSKMSRLRIIALCICSGVVPLMLQLDWQLSSIHNPITVGVEAHSYDIFIGYLGETYDKSPSSSQIIAFIAPVLSIFLTLCSCWPYYLAYRGLLDAEALPLKFTLMSIVSGGVNLHCGLWLGDHVVIASGGFNFVFMLICFYIRERCFVLYKSASLTRFMTRVMFMSVFILSGLLLLASMSDRIKEIFWLTIQVLPNVALTLDYRTAWIRREMTSISMPMLIACFLCNFVWLLYGFNQESLALIVPSTTGLFPPVLGVIIYHVIKHGISPIALNMLLFTW